MKFRILVKLGDYWYVWQEGLALWQVEVMVPEPYPDVRIEAEKVVCSA